ncbi:hypothetical protein KAW48_03590 [candidate division WOR-3 bacterium]|nr:hypothetical protein [candidate division WOR-3 bacterium]
MLPLALFSILFIIDEILVFFLQDRTRLFNLLIDATYLSLFIGFTGGFYSPFAPFYFTLIVFAAYLLSPISSFIIAGYSGILYGFICFGIPNNLPERLLLFQLPEVPTPVEALLTFIIYSLSFIFTAALSSFIVERFKKEVVRLKVTTGDILEAMDQAIITLDDEKRIVWSNSTASTMLNKTFKTGDFLNEVLYKPLRSTFEKIVTGEKEEFEFEYNDRTYKLKRNDLNQEQGTILVINDVTREKEIEKEMQMRGKLITLGQFAANLAHEVRNPVSSIRASAELFKPQGKYSQKNEQLKQLIIDESDHLNGLVEKFLEFTKDFEVKLKDIYLRDAFEKTKSLLKMSKYFNDKITIEDKVDKHILINADPNMLKSVLVNLGTNSLKSMRNGGRLIFNAVRNEKIIIEVEDTGYGISEEDMNNIFSPFFSRFNDGFGFGLAIVKRIVKLHGWDIRVESKLGQGTKFKIII